MAKLRITGIVPFDGEYDLDISRFNGDDLHTIKEISGVRGGELTEAFAAGDYDLVVALTVIVLRRAGRTVDPKQIRAADIGAITVDLTGDEEVEERPPSSALPNGNENANGGSGEQNGSTKRSGEDSVITGDPSRSHLALTGRPGSETSVESAQETLAS